MSSKIHSGVLSPKLLCPMAGRGGDKGCWILRVSLGWQLAPTDLVLGRRQLKGPRKVRRRVHGPAWVLMSNIGEIESSWLHPCFGAELETSVMEEIKAPWSAGNEGAESPTALF